MHPIVLFHQSLHHFKELDYLLGENIKSTLKNEGIIIINEYVGPNRLQYSKENVKAINQALHLVPLKFRKIQNTKIYKNWYQAPGLLRMIISDPSECIESEKILGVIRENYDVLEEKEFGGNILMPALKHISHHFVSMDKEKEDILDKLIEFEQKFLYSHKSHFVFGIYQK